MPASIIIFYIFVFGPFCFLCGPLGIALWIVFPAMYWCVGKYQYDKQKKEYDALSLREKRKREYDKKLDEYRRSVQHVGQQSEAAQSWINIFMPYPTADNPSGSSISIIDPCNTPRSELDRRSRGRKRLFELFEKVDKGEMTEEELLKINLHDLEY